MAADYCASFGIVSNGNSPKGCLSNGHSRDHERSEADASDGKDAGGDTTPRDQAASQSADGDDAGGDIAHRNDPASMAARFIA